MKNFQGAQGQASRSVRMKNTLLISKLQHRNLGRVTGCCIEREEKMIVYEYQESRSLDSFLFATLARKERQKRKTPSSNKVGRKNSLGMGPGYSVTTNLINITKGKGRSHQTDLL